VCALYGTSQVVTWCGFICRWARHFGKMYFFHFRNENGVSTFHRNVGVQVRVHMASQPKRATSVYFITELTHFYFTLSFLLISFCHLSLFVSLISLFRTHFMGGTAQSFAFYDVNNRPKINSKNRNTKRKGPYE
jgi:E3 ubiquitin-protein ligase DOA10